MNVVALICPYDTINLLPRLADGFVLALYLRKSAVMLKRLGRNGDENVAKKQQVQRIAGLFARQAFNIRSPSNIVSRFALDAPTMGKMPLARCRKS